MLPKRWVWVGVDPNLSDVELRTRYQNLARRGVQGVFLGGQDERTYDAVLEAGLALHIWMWTTNRGDAWIRENRPDWYMVSRSGKSCFDQPPYVDYYRWISPCAPGVPEYLEERVHEIASHPKTQGVHLDYVRYPDVILPRALWDTYGLDQTEEMDDYDFCYSDHTRRAFREATGRDPLEIADPATDQEWLRFRYDSVTSIVKRLTSAAHAHEKPITAAVFPTPSMARKICRQSWSDWPLDAACPMIYHSFYLQDTDWIGDCVREDIQAVTFPIIAGLYMPAFSTPEEFAQGLRIARRRGAHGVSLFGDVPEAMWPVFEQEAGA